MDWQPIATAPKDGTRIDLWVGGERHTDCAWYKGNAWHPEDGWYDPAYEYGDGWFLDDDEFPSHWMPFPAPPQEG